MSVFLHFESGSVAREPSQNILCNDWKFPRFSPCKKEHNASIFSIRHGIETPHGKHTRHSLGCKLTTFILIHQTFRELFLLRHQKGTKPWWTLCLIFIIYSTFGSDEVIEVKGVNDDTQSMKIRNEERCGWASAEVKLIWTMPSVSIFGEAN